MRVALSSPLILCALSSGCSKHASPSCFAQDAGSPNGPSASRLSLNAFEGQIVASVKQNQPGQAPVPLVLSVKSDRIRIDMPERIGSKPNPFGGGAYILIDTAEKRTAIISDAQRQALVVDLTKSGEQLAGLTGLVARSSPGGSAANGATTKVTKTGTFETVASFPCENWELASDHRETTICVAQEDVAWFKVPTAGVPADGAPWMAELVDGKHLPLRLVSYAKDGATEEVRIEVTKIDKRSLSAAQFEYPSTYRTIDLTQMLQGLANAPRPAPARSLPSQLKAQ
jgi:hypothetical protein